jgi:hypothetical protein
VIFSQSESWKSASSAGLCFAAVLSVLVPGAGGPPGKTGGPPATKAAEFGVLVWFRIIMIITRLVAHAREQHTHAQGHVHTHTLPQNRSAPPSRLRWSARRRGTLDTPHSTLIISSSCSAGGHDDLELRIEPCMAARRSADSPNHATRPPYVSNPAGSRNGRQHSALSTRMLAQASATARPHRAQRVQDYTAVRPPFPVRGPQHSHQLLVGVAAPSPTSADDGAMPIPLSAALRTFMALLCGHFATNT